MSIEEVVASIRLTIAEVVEKAHFVLGRRTRTELMAVDLTTLERRVLLSASPIPVQVAEVGLPGELAPMDHGDAEATSTLASVDSSDLVLESTDSRTQSPSDIRRELVFLDVGLSNLEQLLDDLWSNHDSNRELEVVLLTCDSDGIEQISEKLAEYDELDAVHIVSHGTDGQVKLGNTWLSARNLDGYAGELTGWREALAADADLLLYGCDLASTETGTALLESLGALCDCDVAASTDDTGHALLGGDWELEYQIGDLESQIVFSANVQQSWSSLLAVMNVNQTADVVNGNVTSVANLIASDGGDGISLREAILAANADSGIADTIMLGSGTFTLSGGSGEDSALSGDLDITDDLTIVGAGTGTTTIAAGGNGLLAGTTDRVFHIFSGIVTISDVSITGGDITGTGGGGFRVESGSTLNLTDVAIDNNAAADGGGIFSQGTVTLTGVTISNNATSSNAGGVWTSGPSSNFTATNVTFSGNTTPGNGGGLYNAKNATLQNVTIVNNSASQGAGIHETGGGATTNIRNTLVAGNLTSADVSGNYNSMGNNLIENIGSSTGWGGSDILGVAPTLGALADNGGPTLTHVLLDGSRGIDEGSHTGAPATDQRGAPRDATADIGAYEFVAVSTLVVDTASDVADGDTTSISALLGNKGADGFISLREAIEATNATTKGATPDRIEFNIGGGGQQTILVGAGGLPTISEAVVIDATTQGGYAGSPLIVLDGNSAGSVSGLVITSGGSTVRGLVINQFADYGIYLNGGSGNIIQGNYIGTDITGAVAFGNSGAGVMVLVGSTNNTIGGTVAGSGNIVAHSGLDGVIVKDAGTAGNSIQGNAIYSNTGLGIDLADDGVTSNDAGDGDTGVNGLQNFPVLTSAAINGSTVTIDGTLNSAANTTLAIHFYASTSADGSGHGEAERYLGTANVTTDGSGNVTINEVISASVADGEFVTATATDPSGNTSEFAGNVAATASNTVPTITSYGGGPTVALNVAENSTAVTTVAATDPEAPPQVLTYSISVNEDNTLMVDWWNANWTRRQELTFDNLVQTEDLVDFPVLVVFDGGNINYGQTQDAGEDLRFFDSDGTQLAHEIEVWNEAGSSYVWVKVPQIDGSSDADSIWVYYGNAAATDGQDPTAVWSNGYASVWHLDDDPSLGLGAITDSTDNPNEINDGTSDSNVETVTITVNSMNDEEVLATNTGTTVNEASTGIVITSAMLETTDVDNTAAQLTYTVTIVTGNGTGCQRHVHASRRRCRTGHLRP